MQIDYEPIRSAQRENTVVGGVAEVEYDARSVVFRPYTDILDSCAGLGRQGHQDQQSSRHQAQVAHRSKEVPKLKSREPKPATSAKYTILAAKTKNFYCKIMGLRQVLNLRSKVLGKLAAALA